jgi:hypothetical protein
VCDVEVRLKHYFTACQFPKAAAELSFFLFCHTTYKKNLEHWLNTNSNQPHIQPLEVTSRISTSLSPYPVTRLIIIKMMLSTALKQANLDGVQLLHAVQHDRQT